MLDGLRDQLCFFFQAEDGIRDLTVTGVQTCALPIYDGTVLVRCGTTSFGQGHETSLAQIAAAQLDVPMESVRVVHSDTDVVERGLGTEIGRASCRERV